MARTKSDGAALLANRDVGGDRLTASGASKPSKSSKERAEEVARKVVSGVLYFDYLCNGMSQGKLPPIIKSSFNSLIFYGAIKKSQVRPYPSFSLYYFVTEHMY